MMQFCTIKILSIKDVKYGLFSNSKFRHSSWMDGWMDGWTGGSVIMSTLTLLPSYDW